MSSNLINYDFSIEDWAVFGSVLGISFLIALINGILSRRKKNTDEFLMGGRNVPLLPTAMSMMSSFISAITIVGMPAEVYALGPQYAMTQVGWIIGAVLAMIFVIPMIYPLKLTSVFEYYERRYGTKAPRYVGAALGVFHQVVYIGASAVPPAAVLEAMIGFESWKSVLVIGCLSTIPTVIGGLKGVIWMDTFQGLIMYGSMIAILVRGSHVLGGFDKVMSSVTENHNVWTLAWPHDKFTVWSAMFGGMFMWFSVMGLSQPAVQRYSAIETQKKSMWTMGLGLFIQVSIFVVALLNGFVLYAYFAGRGCDPLAEGLLTNMNHLVPALVLGLLPYPGIPGLFMASVFSGAYSSFTSSLTAVAANVWEDFLKERFAHKGPNFQTWVVRITVVVAGVVGMGIAFAGTFAGGSVMQLSVAFINTIVGPLTGLFLLSALFPQANWIGACISTLVSFAFVLWMAIGSYLYVVKSVYIPPSANVTCVLPGFNVSSNFSTTAATLTTTKATDEGGLYSFYETYYLLYSILSTCLVIVIGLPLSLLTKGCSTKAPALRKEYFLGVFGYYCCGVETESEKDPVKMKKYEMQEKTNGAEKEQGPGYLGSMQQTPSEVNLAHTSSSNNLM